MAGVYKGLTIKIGADTTKLSSALRSAQSQASGVQKELNKISKALKFDPGNTSLLAAQQVQYQKQIAATEERLKVLKQAESEIGKANMSTEQWTELQADIAMTTSRLNSYKAALKESQVTQAAANSTLGQAGAKLTDIGNKLSPVAQKMSQLGATLTKTVTVGMVGVGAASVKAATEIDTSLTSVKKTVDGTAEQYENLKQKAIEFSQTNAVSASQILDIQALGAQLGFSIDELEEFSEVVSGLDIATNMDAETAATELAQFANITKMSHDEVRNYGSTIVDLGNKFATTESDISRMAMRVAAAGVQVGMSEADILGLSTALSSMGIEAEAGGTAISTVMSSIDKAVALNSDSLTTWAQTANMSTEEFAAAWKDNAVDALSQVLIGMDSAVESGGNMSVMLDELGISSIRQTDMLKRMANNSEFLGKAVNTANEAWAENSALSAEVENRNNSLAAKFTMLKNRVIAVAEKIGKPLADALLNAIDAAEPLFTAIENGAKAFSEMSKEQQQTILKFAAFIAALGPLLTIAGKASGTIGGLGKACTALSKQLATIKVNAAQGATGLSKLNGVSGALKGGIVALGVALAGLAISAIVDHFQKMKEAQETLTKATDGLKNSINTVNTAIDSVDATNATNSLSTYKAACDDALKSQAELADSMSATWGELNGKTAQVSDFVATIEQYADVANLSKDAQDKLAAAVAGYNSATGSSVEITDFANGKLSVSTEELKKNAEAWERNAKMQALQNDLTNLYSQQLKDQEALTKATEAKTEAEKKYNDILNSNSPYAHASASEYKRILDETVQTEQDMQAALDATNETISSRSSLYGNLQREQQVLSMSMEQLAEVANQFGIKSQEGIENFKNAMLEGCTQVQAAAVTVSDTTLQELDAMATQAGIEGDEAVNAFYTSVANGASPAQAAAAQIRGISVEELNQTAAQAGVEGTEAVDAYSNAILNGYNETQAAAAAISGCTVEELDQTARNAGIEGDEAMNAYYTAIRNGQSPTQAAAEAAKSAATKPLNSAANEASSAGSNAGRGFVNGIGSWVSRAANKAWELANAAANAIKGALNINSPSKVTMKFGGYFSEGFAEGIEDKAKLASKQATLMAADVVKQLNADLNTNMTLDMTKIQKNLQSQIQLASPSVSTTSNVTTNTQEIVTALTSVMAKIDTLSQIVNAKDTNAYLDSTKVSTVLANRSKVTMAGRGVA